MVAIVTPNHLHHAHRARLPRRRHRRDLRQAADDHAGARRSTLVAGSSRSERPVFALTHNYTGYPMVRQAREMVAAGELGEIRVVQVEYPQDWLATDLEATGQKQADWRIDPARRRGRRARRHRHACRATWRASSPGLELAQLAPTSTRFVPGRRLDDNVHVMLRYDERRARHAVGEPGGAGQRERAARAHLRRARPACEWRQEDPNQLLVHAAGRAAAADHARRRRRRRRRGATPRASRPATPRAISKASPALPRRRRADRGALAKRSPIRARCWCRPWRTARAA